MTQAGQAFALCFVNPFEDANPKLHVLHTLRWFQKHGAGVEKSHAGHVFKGTWKENRKHGEGIRTLRSNVEEMQVRNGLLVFPENYFAWFAHRILRACIGKLGEGLMRYLQQTVKCKLQENHEMIVPDFFSILK